MMIGSCNPCKKTCELCFAVHGKEVHRWEEGCSHRPGTLTCFQQLNIIKMWGCFSNVTHSCRGQTFRNIYNCQIGTGNVRGVGHIPPLRCNSVYAKDENSTPLTSGKLSRNFWINTDSVLDVIIQPRNL